MASSITGQTFANSDVVAGQKFYAANYIALIAQMQALNDELVSECVTLTGDHTLTGAVEFTGIVTLKDASVMKTSTAPTADAQIANKKYVDDTVAAVDGLIKAWVVFDGTATNPITKDDGLNISSAITKHGTGDYTISWDTDFADGNYAISGIGLSGGVTSATIVSIKEGTVPLAGSVRIVVTNDAGTRADYEYVSIIAIGTQ